MPLSALDNNSPLFQDDARESGEISGPPTINIVNTSPILENNGILCNSHQNAYDGISSNNDFKNNSSSHNESTKSPTKIAEDGGSPTPPPPLIVRSFSNGILKQTGIYQNQQQNTN